MTRLSLRRQKLVRLGENARLIHNENNAQINSVSDIIEELIYNGDDVSLQYLLSVMC